VPIKTEVDHSDRLVRWELSGDLDTDEMLAAVDEAFRLIGGKPGYDFLCDNRALKKPATPEQIKILIGRFAKEGKLVNGSRCAVVVGQAASYGMMRLMAAHADPIGIDVAAFWTIEEAMAFLGRTHPTEKTTTSE
jgi:hypothetical protein